MKYLIGPREDEPNTGLHSEWRKLRITNQKSGQASQIAGWSQPCLNVLGRGRGHVCAHKIAEI